MKKSLKRILGIVVTSAVLVCTITKATDLLKLKSISVMSDMTSGNYFEYAAEYDVLFLGTSHVMYGIYPMELWGNYGITSYNWGSPTCTLPSVYWKLMNILEYATPKLVVVDCFRATWEDKAYNKERMHQAFDPFDLSPTKIKAVNDLMDDESKFTRRDKLEVLFKLSAYHSRWGELSKRDFINDMVDKKGGEFEINVAVPIAISQTSKKATVTPEMEGVNYLKKIIAECQKRNIPILLTYLPYPTSEEWKMEANMIQDIADEYSVNYINFTNQEVVNYNTDFADSSSHMNPSGGKKVTQYIGEYIRLNYGIEDHRADESISDRWMEEYCAYKKDKESTLIMQTSIQNYLMLIADRDYNAVIEIYNQDFYLNEIYLELLTNLGVDREEISADSDFIVINGGAKATVCNSFIECGGNAKTAIGEINSVIDDKLMIKNTYLNGEKIYEAGMADDVKPDVRIVLIDSATSEVIENAVFMFDAQTLSKIL